MNAVEEFIEQLAGHGLVAVAHDGDRCACGDRRPRILEHFEELVWAAFPPSEADRWRMNHARAERENRYPRSRRARRSDDGVTLADVARARRILDRRQAEHERLGRIVDSLGLPLLDALDWLIARDPGWYRRNGWPTPAAPMKGSTP